MGKENIEKIILLEEMKKVFSYCRTDDELKKDFAEYYQDKVLSYNDPNLAYWFVEGLPQCDLSKFSELFSRYADEKINYNFISMYHNELDDKDIKKNLDTILKSNNLYYIYYSALTIPHADVRKHGNAIIESKDLKYNFKFAGNVKGADIKAHEKVILDSKDLYYNALFAAKVKGADIRKHETILFNSNDPYYNYIYVYYMDIERINEYSVDKVLNLILNSRDELRISDIYKDRLDILKKINKIEEFKNFIDENRKKTYKRN